LLVAVAAVATLAFAGGAGGRVVASADGASGFDIHNRFGLELIEVGPFTFNVQVHADGSVHGNYLFKSIDDGTPFRISGSLTCAVIQSNRVWVGGIIEKTSDPSLAGVEMWFQSADNGEPGSDETPDMTTIIGAGGPGTAQDYCDRHPEPRNFFAIERGNIQVRSG
jgi:hypothetical protein